MILHFLIRFLVCKIRSPLGTAALFVLPVWVGCPFWDLVVAYGRIFEVVARYPAGTRLFTSPNQAGPMRKDCGPTRWPVVVVRVAPGALVDRLTLDDLRGWLDDDYLFG